MKRTSTLLLLAILATKAFANGDPVVEYSALTLSRTPVSRHIPEIQIVHEWLDIYPADMHTRVHVRYRLHNTSDKDFTDIRYGFPIDWYGTNDSLSFAHRDVWTESLHEVGWRNDYVINVSFALNGKSLPWQYSKDSILHKKGSEEALRAMFDSEDDYINYIEDGDFDSYDFENQLNRRWYYTTLFIPAHSMIDLIIDYSLANSYTMSLYGQTEVLKDAIVTWKGTYDNSYKTNYNIFSYDFSPAAAWGNGKADTIEVYVHTQAIVHNENPKYDAWNNHIHGIAPDTLSNGDLRFVAAPFDYAAAEPLSLAFMAKREMKENLDYIFSHRLTPDKYTVYLKQGKDSTVVEKEVSDLNFKTATHLPFEKGETELRIHFNQPEHVTGVILLNGNCKDATKWESSSKIKMMKVKGINGSEKYESQELSCFGYSYSYKSDKWPFRKYVFDPASCRLTPPKEFSWEGVIAAADKMNVALILSHVVYDPDGNISLDEWESERITDLYFTISETTDMKAFTVSEIIILTSPPDESVYGNYTYKVINSSEE